LLATALIQALGSALLLFIFSFPIVPSWYIGKYLVDNLSTSIESIGAMNTVNAQWVWIPIVVPAWMVFFTAITILFKWIIIGRYREGVVILSTISFLRWWFVDRSIALWEFWVGRVILNTPLINLIYFLMGANIHRSATVDAFIREFDLVNGSKW